LEYALNLTDNEYDRATLRTLLAACVLILATALSLVLERMWH